MAEQIDDDLTHYMKATGRMRERAEKAEADLARVEAERDEARRWAEHIEEGNWPWEWVIATRERERRKAAEAERDRLRERVMKLEDELETLLNEQERLNPQPEGFPGPHP